MKKWLWVALGAWGCAGQPAASVLSSVAPAASASPPSTSASTSATATPAAATVESGPWLSLYGVSIRLPQEWKDDTEYAFLDPSQRKGHLVFASAAELSPAFAADRQQAMLDMASTRPAMSVSDVRTTATPFGEASLFDVVFGAASDAEAMALVVIPQQPFWLSLGLRGSRGGVAQLSATLATLQALPEGELLPPPGRYAAFGLSFSWPQPLVLPTYFSFKSKDREARLRVEWLTKQPELEELDWDRQFSVPPGETPRLLRVEQGPLRFEPGALRGASAAPPHGFSAAPLEWTQLARVVQINDHQSVPEVLTFLHAYAKAGERYLKVEYYDSDRQRSTLDQAYVVLSTVHAQQ